MSHDPIHEAIEHYAAGAPRLSAALAGLSPDELLARPVPGTWSIQEIALHLWDSDLVAADRMKRVIAEDAPVLVNFDETRAVTRLDYAHLDPHAAAELFRLHRLYMAHLLRQQPVEAFARSGQHTEAGKMTLLDLVTTYAHHLDHHLEHLHRKRSMLGKPLSTPDAG